MSGQLLLRGDRIVAQFPYDDDQRHAVKALGARWHPESKTWRVPVSEADAILELAQRFGWESSDIERLIEQQKAQAQATLKASSAADSELEIPAPEGREFRPFQKAGVAYALGRPATLIGDEMGLGKTIQAIGVINSDESIKRVLIVAPLGVKLNWRSELEKWLIRPMSIGLANAKSWPEADITIVHPAVLAKHSERLRAQPYDLIVVDEAHQFKSHTAQRSNALFGGKQKSGEWIGPVETRRKLALTGTPIPNRPAEIFTILRWLDPNRWNNFRTFAIDFCSGHETRYGFDASGASNLGELRSRLRSTVMVRRLKRDVLSELPPKIRQVVTLDPAEVGPDARRAVKAEQAAEARAKKLVKELEEQAAATKDEGGAAYAEAVAKLKQAREAHFTEMSRLRHATALAKAPKVVEQAQEMLDGGIEKLCIWGHHLDVIKILVDGLSENGVVSIVGGMKEEDRQQAIEAFQNDPQTRVFVGSITAAGVGITLTAASTVVFAELDWVPGNLTQAEDRCHRIGQEDRVLVQHILLDGSIDAKVAKIVLEKQEIIKQSLDGAVEEQDELESLLAIASAGEPQTVEEANPVGCTAERQRGMSR